MSPINTTEAIMSCSHHCNQGRNCNGSCRRNPHPHDDATGYAILYIGWIAVFASLAWMLWG